MGARRGCEQGHYRTGILSVAWGLCLPRSFRGPSGLGFPVITSSPSNTSRGPQAGAGLRRGFHSAHRVDRAAARKAGGSPSSHCLPTNARYFCQRVVVCYVLINDYFNAPRFISNSQQADRADVKRCFLGLKSVAPAKGWEPWGPSPWGPLLLRGQLPGHSSFLPRQERSPQAAPEGCGPRVAVLSLGVGSWSPHWALGGSSPEGVCSLWGGGSRRWDSVLAMPPPCSISDWELTGPGVSSVAQG